MNLIKLKDGIEMLIVENIIAVLYLLCLFFKKKYPVSLSTYWVAIFYLIYIFVPMIRGHIAVFNGISERVVEEIAIYSLVGLLLFMLTNCVFLFKWGKMICLNDISTKLEISFLAVRKLQIIVIIMLAFLLLLNNGISGITNILWKGSRNILLYKNDILTTISQLLFFYLNIISSLVVLTARTKREKFRSILIYILIIIVSMSLVFARRYVIYPLFSVVFYKLSQQKSRKKIFLITSVFALSIVVLMLMMGYFRTYGINNFTLISIINYFENGNILEIIISNTDFAASYYFLSRQVEYGDIFVGPLGYFKIFFAFIPRSLWPNKPNYTSIEILSIIEPDKVQEGFSAATGYIGEALAALGIGGVVLVSLVWGVFCGYMDKKYQYVLDKKRKEINSNRKENDGFTLFEYLYLYAGSLLITEIHRGDFGAASIHFVLEIVLIGVLAIVFSRKYKRTSKIF